MTPAPHRLRRHSPNHDDHCLVTFEGRTWRIVRMRGLGRISLASLDGRVQTGLDLSRADLGAYCATAADWLRPDLGIDNAEMVEGPGR